MLIWYTYNSEQIASLSITNSYNSYRGEGWKQVENISLYLKMYFCTHTIIKILYIYTHRRKKQTKAAYISKSTISRVGQLLLSGVGNVLLQSPTISLFSLVKPLEIVALSLFPIPLWWILSPWCSARLTYSFCRQKKKCSPQYVLAGDILRSCDFTYMHS